jgi:hypothetical protein
MMIEIVEPPSTGVGVALGIFDGYVGAIPRSGEIAPPRRFGPRSVWVLRRRQRELQLFKENCPFRKNICLLVDLV